MASPHEPLEIDETEPHPPPSPQPSERDETEPHPPASDKADLLFPLSCISWSNSTDCDHSGKRPSVSINKEGIIVVVHKRGVRSDLRYKVGRRMGELHGNIVWGYSYKFDNGYFPSVAINDNGTVVEVHQSQWRRALFYRVGVVNVEDMKIDWVGRKAKHYSSGSKPSVALNNKAKPEVVAVHMTDSLHVNGTLFCVGTLGENSEITWSVAATYGEGKRPKVAINDNGTVVEVHELVQPKEKTACVVGQLRMKSADHPAASDIEWGPTTHLGRGSNPHIALNNDNRVVEVHERSFRNIRYSGGVIHVEPKAMTGLSDRNRYQEHKLCDGISPTVSMNDDGKISFVCETSNQMRHTLLCHTGTWTEQ